MMSTAPHSSRSSAGRCRHEEALHAYIDGELADTVQPELFAHLAQCAACRRQLDGVMAFRRMSRLEPLAVPAAADDAFLKRLAAHRQARSRTDRQAVRQPLWQVNTLVSVRVAVTVALVVFLTGMLLPGATVRSEPAASVTGEEEIVLFTGEAGDAAATEAVYVFYPGLTVEARKADGGVAGGR